MRVRFNKTDGFIRIYDRTRYLMLLGSEKYNVIYDRIRYLMSLKRGITYIFSFVPEDDIECESFTVISIDSLLIYENKSYLQAYLGNCA